MDVSNLDRIKTVVANDRLPTMGQAVSIINLFIGCPMPMLLGKLATPDASACQIGMSLQVPTRDISRFCPVSEASSLLPSNNRRRFFVISPQY
jgi:hypothetical protein